MNENLKSVLVFMGGALIVALGAVFIIFGPLLKPWLTFSTILIFAGNCVLIFAVRK